jgi:hypothetical protein
MHGNGAEDAPRIPNAPRVGTTQRRPRRRGRELLNGRRARSSLSGPRAPKTEPIISYNISILRIILLYIIYNDY